MINIYCLINPVTGLPFYVGATKRKLNERLANHIADSYCIWGLDNGVGKSRRLLIQSFIKAALKPKIRLLAQVQPEYCDKMEKWFYDYFISQGVDLLQISTKFCYQQQKIKQNTS